MAEQVKSKQRVADHGEVFTNEREVNAMLDMVKQETERIDSRFLEPACGDGNFLAEILRRKLAVVSQRYGKNVRDWEKYAFVAVGSIYGVELLPDNAADCRARLFAILEASWNKVTKATGDPRFLDAIRYVLSRNILNGDASQCWMSRAAPSSFRNGHWSQATKLSVATSDWTRCSKATGSTSSSPFSVQAGQQSPTGNTTRKPNPSYPNP